MKIIGKFPSTRLRRVRNSDWVRRLVSENSISVDDLILPFLSEMEEIKLKKLKVCLGYIDIQSTKIKYLDKAERLRIPMVALFPYTSKKDKFGSEALNENNILF